jgi:sulfite reductase alpha subunit-like flavoprotein
MAVDDSRRLLEFDLVVSLLQFDDPATGKVMSGFASSYLTDAARCGAGKLITLSLVRMPSFRLPFDLRTPVILICTGAGVAPVRAFWQERARRLHQQAIDNAESASGGADKASSDFIVIYGCKRRDDGSWLFRDEMEAMNQQKVITSLKVAFSRESATPRQYVQDILRDGADLHNVIKNPATQVIICGRVSMAESVETALVDILGSKRLVAEMKKNNRLKVDVFGGNTPSKQAH